MDTITALPLLDHEWDLEKGCLGRLRSEQFDPDSFERLVQILTAIRIEESAVAIDRRFVALTWYIPLFLEWQIERLRAQGKEVSALDLIAAKIGGLVEGLLGVP